MGLPEHQVADTIKASTGVRRHMAENVSNFIISDRVKGSAEVNQSRVNKGGWEVRVVVNSTGEEIFPQGRAFVTERTIGAKLRDSRLARGFGCAEQLFPDGGPVVLVGALVPIEKPKLLDGEFELTSEAK